jgi:uncharacterized membrane protein YkoI
MTKSLRTAAATLVLAALACPLRAGEEKVPLDKVPRAVLETVKARFKDAKVIEASKEMEKEKLVYEVTIKHADHKIDVTLTPEGEMLLIEKEVAAKDLPKAVAGALEKKYPKATYKIIEEIIKVERKAEKLTHYEVFLETADSRLLEVQLSSTGEVLKEEKKKGKD